MRHATCCFALLLFLTVRSIADSTLSNSDPDAFASAVQAGGSVSLQFDGSVSLLRTLTITNNTTVDGTGHLVLLDAGQAFPHFKVIGGASLRLIHLTLANGVEEGHYGYLDSNQTVTPSQPGMGGAVFVTDASLDVTDCRFSSNRAVGGAGLPGHGAPGYGGAIYVTNGLLSVKNSSFDANRAIGGAGGPFADWPNSAGGGDAFGGGIFYTNSRISVVLSVFSNNLAQAGEMKGAQPTEGGGIAYGGALADGASTTQVSRCLFFDNRALGATRVSFQPGMDNSGNAAGGAVAHGGGSMMISESSFLTNSATGGPGKSRATYAMYISADGLGGAVYSAAGDLSLAGCTLAANAAVGGDVGFLLIPIAGRGGMGLGGGVYNQGQLTLTNCTLFGNAARGGAGTHPGEDAGGNAQGGGITMSGGMATLLNVTMASNRVQVGASPHPAYGTLPTASGASIAVSTGTVSVVNCILAAASDQTNVSGLLQDLGHNLSSDASTGFSASSSREGVDPLLEPLADNGGPTLASALRAQSPAIDAGDDAASPATDQRGFPRPLGSASDIGAFELAPKLTLSRDSDGLIALTYAFAAGRTNLISASTNLTDWIPLGQKVLDVNGTMDFEDPESDSVPFRFYRVEEARPID